VWLTILSRRTTQVRFWGSSVVMTKRGGAIIPSKGGTGLLLSVQSGNRKGKIKKQINFCVPRTESRQCWQVERLRNRKFGATSKGGTQRVSSTNRENFHEVKRREEGEKASLFGPGGQTKDVKCKEQAMPAGGTLNLRRVPQRWKKEKKEGGRKINKTLPKMRDKAIWGEKSSRISKRSGDSVKRKKPSPREKIPSKETRYVTLRKKHFQKKDSNIVSLIASMAKGYSGPRKEIWCTTLRGRIGPKPKLIRWRIRKLPPEIGKKKGWGGRGAAHLIRVDRRRLLCWNFERMNQVPN